MPRAEEGRLQDPSGTAQGPDRFLLMGCYSVFVSMYMLVSLVAPFFPSRADDWGITSTEVGFITSCDPLGEVIAAVFSGWLIAKLGTKKAAVGGMAVNGLAGLCFGLAPLVTEDRDVLVPVFVVTRMISGGATTVAYVAVFTMLCVMQPDKVGQVTAYCNVLTAVGLMVGPLFGGVFDEASAQTMLPLLVMHV
jgi:MFS family permease